MVKVTRRLLEDYRKNKRSIPLLEEELDEMRHGEKGLGSSVILDYSTGYPVPQGIVGFNGSLYDQRRKTLDRKKAECKAVEDWIGAIEDGQARCVFRMFYMEGLTWERIAIKTGYSKSPDYPRLYIRDTYLKKCGIL